MPIDGIPENRTFKEEQLFYPGRFSLTDDDNLVIEPWGYFKSQGVDAELVRADFWQMNSIYDEHQNDFLRK